MWNSIILSSILFSWCKYSESSGIQDMSEIRVFHLSSGIRTYWNQTLWWMDVLWDWSHRSSCIFRPEARRSFIEVGVHRRHWLIQWNRWGTMRHWVPYIQIVLYILKRTKSSRLLFCFVHKSSIDSISRLLSPISTDSSEGKYCRGDKSSLLK